MQHLIYFISTSDFSACEIPAILQVIYFGKLIFNIVHIIIPIGLIVYMMIDFSKCLIIGDESKQSSIVKLSFKRIMYAVVVYAVPYIVSVFANIMSDFIPDYNSCLANATPENIEYYTAQYEEESKKEEEERKEAWKQDFSKKFVIPDYSATDFYNSSANLKQCGNSSWASYPIACAQNRRDATICSSGCGYVAYTMVVRNFGYTDITPDKIVDIACNEYGYNYSAASYDFLTSKILNDRFGMVGEYIGRDQAESALREGKSLIINIPGHYISVLGINADGTLIVGDSAFSNFASNGVYTVDTLYQNTAYFRPEYGWHVILAYSKK